MNNKPLSEYTLLDWLTVIAVVGILGIIAIIVLFAGFF